MNTKEVNQELEGDQPRWCSTCQRWECECEPESETDFLVQNEGTIYLFRPLTTAAAAHLEENVQEDAQWIGGALVVEHRYAPALAVALKEEGFTLK